MALLICFSASAEKPADLEATGDHSVWVITNDIKDIFTKDTGLTLNLIPELAIVGKGCEKGISLATKGNPAREFGLICCKLDERSINNHGLKVYSFANEPMAILANRKNPVKGLTMDQVRDIFSGRITNWKDVGGADENIAVITKLHCPQHTPNWMKILNSPNKFTKNRVEAKTQPDLAKTVSDFKQAIGHLEMTSVIEAEESGVYVKVLPIDGYMPTSENMAKGLYPIYGTLGLATKGDAQEKVKKFLNYIRTSPKVARVMKKYGMSQTD